MTGLLPGRLPAQVQIVPDERTPMLFGGGARELRVVFRNPTNEMIGMNVRKKVFQMTSATGALLEESAWKQVRVLPGQTIVESAAVRFPAVKGETRFLVQWLEDTNRVIGRTEVLIYPTNLLQELKPLADGEPLGVYDPGRQLRPLLNALAVESVDLEDVGAENFPGRLAILGPFPLTAPLPNPSPELLAALVKKGVAVVWIRPAAGQRDKPQPSFYSVPENQAATVVVQPELVARLAENPQSQLNLIYFCRLALHPEPLRLPTPAAEP